MNEKVHYHVTRAGHWSLSWARWIQSTSSQHISIRSILILYSHLCPGLPRGLFPLGFPTKTVYECLISSMHATCPVYLILLNFITLLIFEESVELYPDSPNAPPWRGAQLKAQGQLYLLLIFNEAYRLWSSSLCSLLQPPTTSSSAYKQIEKSKHLHTQMSPEDRATQLRCVRETTAVCAPFGSNSHVLVWLWHPWYNKNQWITLRLSWRGSTVTK